jgi:redox-sensing transcriptional repressor
MATARNERLRELQDSPAEPKRRQRNGQRNSENPEAAEATTLHVAETIPDIVIRRLPVYIRTLRELEDAGISSVSSDELAARIGVTAAQIRRDLSYFGRFGKQGKGYDARFLADAIAHILKLDRPWDVAVAGFGNLGRAIVHYKGFVPTSYNIAAIFDRHPENIGQQIDNLVIMGDDQIEGEIARIGIKIGIIAVPAQAAQDVADQMIAGGVRAILNYAPIILKLPESVVVREIDPISAMQSMTYYLED